MLKTRPFFMKSCSFLLFFFHRALCFHRHMMNLELSDRLMTVLLFCLCEISFDERAGKNKRIRTLGLMCGIGHQHSGYNSSVLLMLPLTPILMKLPVATNKLNECLEYQAVIAGRLFSLPNY